MPFKLSLSFGRPAKGSSREERTPTFHAVTIQPGEDACSAAVDSNGKRVLSQEAPKLPLENCDRPAGCACRYRHFDDRRDRPRRQADGAPPSAVPQGEDDRRDSVVGRRVEDYADYADAAQPDELADTYYGFRRKPQQ